LDQFEESDTEQVVSLFRDAAEDLKADREVVRKAISLNPSCIEDAHEMFHSDREIMKHVIENEFYRMRLLGEALKHDREIILLACKQNSVCLQYADENTANDKDFVMSIIQMNSGYPYSYIGNTLKKDRQVALACISRDGDCFSEFPDMTSDREIFEIAFAQSCYCLRYASQEIQNDIEIVKQALRL